MATTTLTPATYNTWKTATFGTPYNIWHDGLPVEVVTPLTGTARTQAISMLLYGLQSLFDGDCATALAAMKEISALPALHNALCSSSGDSRVQIAQAIHSLSGLLPPDSSSDENVKGNENEKEKEKEKQKEATNPMARELISVLDDPSIFWGTKIKSAMGLHAFTDQESEDALLRAVEGKEVYLVKYHSCQSLLVRWGVEPSGIAQHRAIFGLIGDRGAGESDEDFERRGREAGRLMRELREKEGKK